MADYINKSILLEAYLHLEPDEDVWPKLEGIREQMTIYLSQRSKFFLSQDVEVQVEFADGSLKKYLTVVGCVYAFLYNYPSFKEGVKLFASDAKRLAESTINESLFVTKCRDASVIHCEARPGILGALEKIVDDIDHIEIVVHQGDLSDALRRLEKSKGDLERLIECLNDERDPDFISTELLKMAERIPTHPKPNPKKPYTRESYALFRRELDELKRHIRMRMREKRNKIMAAKTAARAKT